MQHEVLYALLGYPGDLIAADEAGMRVAADAEFVGDADRALANRLLQVGTLYTRLRGLVERVAGSNAAGIYLSAACNGTREVLTDYEEAVVAMEAKLLRDPSLPLSDFRAPLLSHDQVMDALWRVLGEPSSTEHLRSVRLLCLLDGVARAGTVPVQRAVDRVLYHVRAVFFNQLSAWCLHGLLDDPGREFFIRAARDRGTAVGATGAAAETDEEAALAAVDEFEWHGAYSVEPELVPSSHLSHALTDDVLFAGRAVSLVQDAARRGSHRSHFSEEDAAACGQALDAARNTHPFSALELERAVGVVRDRAARALWGVLSAGGMLERHLRALSRFLLLRDGEFWHAFLAAAAPIMRAPPTLHSERDLNAGPFLAAAHAAGCEDDEEYAHFSVRLQTSEFAYDGFNTVAGLHLIGRCAPSSQHPAVDLLGDPDAPGGAEPAESGPHSPLPPSPDRDLPGSDAVPPTGGAEVAMAKARPAAAALAAAAAEVGESVAGAGALWRRKRVPLADGFRASVTFSLRGACRGLALVLQNAGAFSIGQAPEGMAYGGIPTSVAVEFDCDPLLDTSKSPQAGHVAVHTRVRAPNSPRMPACFGYAEAQRLTAFLAQPVSPADEAGRGRHHAVVEVVPGTGSGAAPSAGVSSSSSWTLCVWLDDPKCAGPPLLRCPVPVAAALDLAASANSGAAWVGVTASASGTASQQQRRRRRELGPARVLVHDLTFVSFGASGRHRPAGQDGTASSSSDAEQGGTARGRRGDPWSALRLHYRTAWPLHLLFTQRTLSQYDALFELLFALRRASFHLTQAWIGVTRWRGGTAALRGHRKDALLLRARIAFFVDTLLNHIQTDVISTLEHKLLDKLRQCGDFHAAVAAHSAFLADAAKGAFIRVGSVKNSIHSIVALALDLCGVLRVAQEETTRIEARADATRGGGSDSARGDAAAVASTLRAELDRVSSEFRMQSQFMFLVMARINARLAVRLDFSGYFSDQSRTPLVNR